MATVTTEMLGTSVDKRSPKFYKNLVAKIVRTFNFTFEDGERTYKRQNQGRKNKIYFMNITSHDVNALKNVVNMINGENGEGTIFPHINGGNSRATIVARLTPNNNLVVEAV